MIDLVTWGWSCWEIPPTNLFAQVAEVRQSALIDHLVLEVDNFATGVFCDDLPIVSHQPRLKCYRPSVKIKNIRGWLCKTNLPDCDIFFIPGSAPGCDDLTMTCDAE